MTGKKAKELTWELAVRQVRCRVQDRTVPSKSYLAGCQLDLHAAKRSTSSYLGCYIFYQAINEERL